MVKYAYKSLALLCFLLLMVQADELFAQSDSLPYPLPKLSAWENPIYTNTSGFYLQTPSILKPKVSYDTESGNYIINQSIGNYQLSNTSYLSF